MLKYRTIQSDTWDMISLKVYGDEHYTDKLMEANTKYIEVVIFPAGVELNTPDIEAIVPSILPPWKR